MSPTRGWCALANSLNADYLTQKQSSPTTTNLRLWKTGHKSKNQLPLSSQSKLGKQQTESGIRIAKKPPIGWDVFLCFFDGHFWDIIINIIVSMRLLRLLEWKGVVWFASHILECSWTPPSLLWSNMTNPEDSVAVTSMKRYLNDTGILVPKFSHWQIHKPISDECT